MKSAIVGIHLISLLYFASDSIGAVLFQESFESTDLSSRGWYDSTTIKLSSTEHIPGSAHSVEYHFPVGATMPEISGSAVRRKFADSDSLYVSYYQKHSSNWVGSGLPYHPHEILILTNLDSDYWGPSESHMTVYIEENNGYPRLAIQDALNIDETRIGQDLTNVTETRAVAGCNGFSQNDGSMPEDCYLVRQGKHRNIKTWTTPTAYFTNSQGPYYKGAWHRIEVFLKMNTIANGRGVADGIVQYWYDGTLIIDHRNVLFRTGQYPNMKFNQFQIAPWIGDGSPVDQTIWIDELLVATDRQNKPSPPRNLRVQ